jgi:nitrogen fixation/metabolism regulation signal transduction histidine kinase
MQRSFLMKNSDLWESIILLLSAILLVPIWMFKSNSSQLSDGTLKLFQILQFVLVVVLVTILVRRLRRVIAAMRENKNRQGPFSF